MSSTPAAEAPSIFPRLVAASAAMHAADQMTLAAIPLLAAAAGADARMIGLLVAAQSAAWLILSLPVGALADRLSRRALMRAGALAAMAGSLLGLLALSLPQTSLWLLALACFATAGGVVTIVLSVFALTPRAIDAAHLPSANARLELARAVATLATPAPAAWLVAHGAGFAVFLASAACGLVSFAASSGLPNDALAKAAPMLASIRDGARFVVAHAALRAIALCAIFWNMAFFALTALFVPFATERLGLDAPAIGRAWTAFGAGLLLSALFAPAIAARFSLSSLLIFGPLVSAAAGAIIAMARPAGAELALWLAFFLLGFGPMLWAVTQTSLRQRLTPASMMGRVGATMQAANYGARPLGALLAAWAGATFGVANAMLLPALLFCASLMAMAWLLRSAMAAAAPAR
ncbi:MAG: MFS transporter [Rhizobiales bacterium]|nr:MFS transporter [Hyphomicrobiales bacterium]